MTLYAKQKQTHRYRKQTCYQRGDNGGVTNQEYGINRYKLKKKKNIETTIYIIKQIRNKDTLYIAQGIITIIL